MYYALGYALIIFLIFRFVTDRELPLYRLLLKVGLSSVGMFFCFNWLLKGHKPPAQRDR